MNNRDDIRNELEEFMLAAELEELNIKIEEDNIRLEIKNKSEADFIIKQVNKLRQEKEEINKFVDQEIERQMKLYEEYRQSRLRPLDSQIAYYEESLKTFTLNEYNETGKKTIKLPNGSIGIQKQQPKYVYNDAEVLEFLQQNDLNEYIRMKPELNKKDLKKNAVVNSNNELIINNQVVPGVVVIPQEDKFEVK